MNIDLPLTDARADALQTLTAKHNAAANVSLSAHDYAVTVLLGLIDEQVERDRAAFREALKPIADALLDASETIQEQVLDYARTQLGLNS